jgi:glycosyltransferase involved in cell wall biosynthesis
VDAYSRDRTAELAEEMAARVFRRKWRGYSDQKNFGIAQASQPWILSLDADEQVSLALAEEIHARLPQAWEAGFTVPIPLYFLGKELGYYFRKNPRYLRMFRKEEGRFNDALVHETVDLKGPIGRLKAPLLHDSYAHPSLSSYWRKIHYYADLEAEQIAINGHGWADWLANRWLRAFGRLGWMLLVRGGLLDGPKAWLWIAGQAYQEWLRSGKAARMRSRRQYWAQSMAAGEGVSL